MQVVTSADPNMPAALAHCRLRLPLAARSRSVRRRHFDVLGIAVDQVHRESGALDQHRLVGGVEASPRPDASLEHLRRKACGCLRQKDLARGGASRCTLVTVVERHARRCFTVSRTGIAAIAAPCAARLDGPADHLPRYERPGGIVNQDDVGLPPTVRANAFATESCRRRRPPTNETACQARQAALPSPQVISGRRRRSRRCGDWKPRRTLSSSSERPPISRNCLGRSAPRRVPRPAAAMMAETRMTAQDHTVPAESLEAESTTPTTGRVWRRATRERGIRVPVTRRRSLIARRTRLPTGWR